MNIPNVELGHICLPKRPDWCPEGWEMEDRITAYRDFHYTMNKRVVIRLKLTCDGRYLVHQSNSWMFAKPESAVAVANIIANERGGGWVSEGEGA
jgi:hypothetical protein